MSATIKMTEFSSIFLSSEQFHVFAPKYSTMVKNTDENTKNFGHFRE